MPASGGPGVMAFPPMCRRQTHSITLEPWWTLGRNGLMRRGVSKWASTMSGLVFEGGVSTGLGTTPTLPAKFNTCWRPVA